MTNRQIALAVLLIAAMSLSSTARSDDDSGRMSIATTARIVKVNFKTRTLVVRSSENTIAREWPVMLPGRITITLPAKGTDYTVVTTNETAFQDGSDPLKFEDFRSGETISIHGVRNGRTLTATRIAKWE